MKKFLIVISNADGSVNYSMPSELYAKDKYEAKQLLLENVEEQYIAGIYTVDEYKKFLNSAKFKQQMLGQIMAAGGNVEDGNKFFDNMIASATAYAEQAAAAEKEDQHQHELLEKEKAKLRSNQQVAIDSKKTVSTTVNSNIIVPVKYFIDNGIQYKIENNELYKKVWKPVEIEESMNDSGQLVYPEFRIVNKDTGKPVKSTKFQVQQLVWELLQIN